MSFEKGWTEAAPGAQFDGLAPGTQPEIVHDLQFTPEVAAAEEADLLQELGEVEVTVFGVKMPLRQAEEACPKDLSQYSMAEKNHYRAKLLDKQGQLPETHKRYLDPPKKPEQPAKPKEAQERRSTTEREKSAKEDHSKGTPKKQPERPAEKLVAEQSKPISEPAESPQPQAIREVELAKPDKPPTALSKASQALVREAAVLAVAAEEAIDKSREAIVAAERPAPEPQPATVAAMATTAPQPAEAPKLPQPREALDWTPTAIAPVVANEVISEEEAVAVQSESVLEPTTETLLEAAESSTELLELSADALEPTEESDDKADGFALEYLAPAPIVEEVDMVSAETEAANTYQAFIEALDGLALPPEGNDNTGEPDGPAHLPLIDDIDSEPPVAGMEPQQPPLYQAIAEQLRVAEEPVRAEITPLVVELAAIVQTLEELSEQPPEATDIAQEYASIEFQERLQARLTDLCLQICDKLAMPIDYAAATELVNQMMHPGFTTTLARAPSKYERKTDAQLSSLTDDSFLRLPVKIGSLAMILARRPVSDLQAA